MGVVLVVGEVPNRSSLEHVASDGLRVKIIETELMHVIIIIITTTISRTRAKSDLQLVASPQPSRMFLLARAARSICWCWV
jgi:hypothetical protein